MKNLFVCISLALFLLPGCKNSDPGQNTAPNANPASADPAAQEPVQPVKLDKEEVDRNLTKAINNLAGLKDLLKQLDALPASVKQNKSEQIETFRNNLSGMTTKMQHSVDDLTGIQKMAVDNKPGIPGNNANGGGMDTPYLAERRMKAYASDLDRYAEDVKNYGQAIKDLAKGGQ